MRRATLTQILADAAAKRPVVLVTNLMSGLETLIYPTEKPNNSGVSSELLEAGRAAVRADRSTTIEGPDGAVFLHVFNPALRLIVVGAVHIAQPLARMAALAGWEVTVVDPRRSFATEERFPGLTMTHEWPDEALERLAPDSRTAVVTLTHDPKLDDAALGVALASPAFYVGSLGSTKTHAARLERLRRGGVDEVARARIHAPIGLDIGAKSPAEIAVAIMAEITQALRRPVDSR